MLKRAWFVFSVAWTCLCIYLVITVNPGQRVSPDENLWFVTWAYIPWVVGFAARVLVRRLLY